MFSHSNSNVFVVRDCRRQKYALYSDVSTAAAVVIELLDTTRIQIELSKDNKQSIQQLVYYVS